MARLYGSLAFLCALTFLASAPGPAQAQATKVTDVRIGAPGDRWLDALPWQRIERATVEGAFGYAVDFRVTGHGVMRFFWPRSRIHLTGKEPRTRFVSLALENGRLWYPNALTARYLPAVHQGVLRLEEAYRKDARGGIAAVSMFALVVGGIDAAPVVAPTVARLLSVRSRTGPVAVLQVGKAPTAAASGARVEAQAAPEVAATTTTAAARPSTAVPEVSTLSLPRTAPRPTAAPLIAGTSRGSPRALGKALEKAGHVRPPGSAVHHIVARNAPGALPARQALQRLGINIDEAANGVFLPATRKSPNPAGASVHSTLHTREYYRAVNARLKLAGTRQEAIGALQKVRELLLAGDPI